MSIKMPKTGLTAEQAETKDLIYWADRKEKEVAEGTSKFAARDAEDAKAMRAELARRNAGGKPAAAPAAKPSDKPSTALARATEPNQLVIGSFGNAKAASEALLAASQQYHLVTPASIVGRLPEGCEVIMSLVQIDTSSSEVYNITGSAKNPKDDDTVGLDKVSLARIMKAMGGSWLSSRRTDNGSHPHYCAWEVWAEFPDFDLRPCRVPGNVDIDTREDGDLCGAAAEEIRVKAEKRRRDHPDWDNDGGDSQLLELRKFLIRHAESKAMNKAIGNYGVRRSYKRHELKTKAFAVARLMFTGHSEDPEARRDFRKMIGERFLGRRQQLYGNAPQIVPQAAPQLHAPPPIGSGPREDYDHDADGEPADATPLPTGGQKPAENPGPSNEELADEARNSGAY